MFGIFIQLDSTLFAFTVGISAQNLAMLCAKKNMGNTGICAKNDIEALSEH
jgi:hypothetical protein